MACKHSKDSYHAAQACRRISAFPGHVQNLWIIKNSYQEKYRLRQACPDVHADLSLSFLRARKAQSSMAYLI